MMPIQHDWDDENYANTLETAYTEYRAACFGEQFLPPQQEQEIKQAFLSGILWLSARDDYCPDELTAALRSIIRQFNPFVF